MKYSFSSLYKYHVIMNHVIADLISTILSASISFLALLFVDCFHKLMLVL